MTRRLGVMTRVLIECIFGDHRLYFTRERVSVEPGLHGNVTRDRGFHSVEGGFSLRLRVLLTGVVEHPSVNVIKFKINYLRYFRDMEEAYVLNVYRFCNLTKMSLNPKLKKNVFFISKLPLALL